MKLLVQAFVPFLLAAPTALWAQCPFDPTIEPDGLVLCPDESSVLTTQAYDSYQWYKGGVPIPGATGQSMPVNSANDAGSTFSVAATLNGCTEMSPDVLVDGWVFLLPFVMTVAPEPLYLTQNGPVYCGLDTVLLILMPPYDVSIQWTSNGNPITGATDDTLMVTINGSYHVSGAPSLCPTFIQRLGVVIDVFFQPPQQPVIAEVGVDQLCATPAGLAYQWYLNGASLDGVDTECIVPGQPGTYTVDVTYDADCSVPSEGFLVTGINAAPDASDLRAGPVPAADRMTITGSHGMTIGQWRLLDATGRVMMAGDGLKRNSITTDVGALGTGSYWLRTDDNASVRVCVAR